MLRLKSFLSVVTPKCITTSQLTLELISRSPDRSLKPSAIAHSHPNDPLSYDLPQF